MEKEKQITLEERRRVQLNMLAEFDTFCRSHSLKYSLAFGTLLGAIRHKGYIPWDDDVDIMMPLPDYNKMKAMLHSDSFRVCDVDSEKYYDFIFPRLADNGSYRKVGKLGSKTYGINIDLYVVVGCPQSMNDKQWVEAKRIHKKGIKLYIWQGRFVRYLPIRPLSIFRRYLKKWRDFFFNLVPYDEARYYYIIMGTVKEKYIFDYDIFDTMTDVDFEGMRLMSIAGFDSFLKRAYGDYMTLPPENERIPYHGGTFYKI